MTMRRFVPFAAVVALLVGPSLLAGGLGKYKDWPSSPQGYFMTSAERAEWKASVKSEADADAFVQKFLDSRGPGFAADVAQRAAIADRRLSVGKRPGSQTLCGKIVILLGPPSGFKVATREVQNGRSASLGGLSGGADAAANAANVADVASQSAMSLRSVNVYTFTYDADRLPGHPANPLQIVVEVNPVDGSDRILDRKAAAQLDDVFDAVNAARLASSKR